MKKLLLILLCLPLLFTTCKKEEEEPNNNSNTENLLLGSWHIIDGVDEDNLMHIDSGYIHGQTYTTSYGNQYLYFWGDGIVSWYDYNDSIPYIENDTYSLSGNILTTHLFDWGYYQTDHTITSLTANDLIFELRETYDVGVPDYYGETVYTFRCVKAPLP